MKSDYDHSILQTSSHTSSTFAPLPLSHLQSLYIEPSSISLIHREKNINTFSEMCPSERYSRSVTDESSDFRPAFDVIDADRDGKISLDDLRTFYAGSLASGATDEDIGSMISVADLNRDGFVEFDEFERVLGSRKSSPKNAVMEEMFRVMDRDGDGKLGFDDLKGYLGWAGLAASDEDIAAMIRLGGGDENGGVCLEGLTKILAV